MKKVFSLLFIISSVTVYAQQNFNNITIDESANGLSFLQLFKSLESNYSIDFICDEKRMDALTVGGIKGKQKLREYLDAFLLNYSVLRAEDNIIFVVEKAMLEEFDWRRGNFLVLKPSSNAKFSLSGMVTDGKTGEPLLGARVYLPAAKMGDASNVEGYFKVASIPQMTQIAEVEFVGYEPELYLIGFSDYGDEKNLKVTLYPESQELETVTVTAKRVDENVVGNLTGVESLSIANIKAIPTFLGEVDPIRSITTLPGVSTAGELASGFNVRGGESGQNLILQDGAPIYNPSHLFGFFSSFNPDMVSNVTLYKGGGPSNFGGRISSVLDIALKNGDDTKTTVSGGIGLVSSRLAVEGPLIKKKLSYMVGGRISYANWLVHATDDIQLQNSSAHFRDVTGKIKYDINDNNIVTFSIYNGYDDFKFATDSVFKWGTTNMTLKWDHTFNDKLFSFLTVYKTKYFSDVQSLNEIEAFNYSNSIENLGMKYEFSYQLGNQNKLTAGIQSVGTLLEPGKLKPAPDVENIFAQDMDDQTSLESAAYVQLDYDLSPKWSISAGIRYSYFMRMGPDNIYQYDYNDIRGRYPAIVDTVAYAKGDVIKTYDGLEPRLSLRYMVTPATSLKVSYYRGYQYLHLISNTTSTTPQDYWVSSGPYLKPQIGDQYSIGYFQNLKQDNYEFSLEGFYKTIENSVDYIDGADITLNPALEAGLLQGSGVAYGVEVFAKKKSGTLNGWIAYTFSRSLRQFDESLGLMTINNGEYYASAFDQPHRLSVILNYKLGTRVVASANFNYNTGRPITIPISKFSYDGYLSVLNYSERNQYRIPDYHRLDLSLTIKDNPRKQKRIKSEWIFSIFNVYSRNNAYSITFDKYGNARKLSVLGSIFPSLTYSFKI